MQGKVCLVTGGTAGIGFVTARELARKGATVVICGRDAPRGEQAARELRRLARNEEVYYQRADLSASADIRRLARNVVEQFDRLDVLVNNAGAIFESRRLSADGIEMTLALNHLNYFLLTNLLMSRLAATPGSRVVVVSSRAHERIALDFDDLQSANGFNSWKAYKRSKLANILFAYELARRIEGTGVTVNALHPGFVASRFGADNGMLFRLGMKVAMTLMAIDVEKGARTPVFLASDPSVEGVSGHYFVDCQERESSPESHDREAARRLWDESVRLIGGEPGDFLRPAD